MAAFWPHGVAPHFESSPETACSLIPKLAVAMRKKRGTFAPFMQALAEELIAEHDAEVCQLIVAAVREVQGGK
jgi:hypothetical protein